ncbi:ClcB-like voltage-gated chloride channel protein [Massilia solisilvae]|uniref:ClcB-like voltage-gated chloride channel protein n=1 Tax=Massilia solisilvae TaxID=1811225 RepID=A0ABT2BSI8_9BURK|nr:ClcB-like voltage-gated chloride channel protein [Massilia solisilvae]MCS0611040.1 ClcB-like voltage-gated chloride channel protein [Massilia solisilvae]
MTLASLASLPRRLPPAHAMLLWAALAGLVGALATIAFRDGLAAMQWAISGHSGSFVEMAAALPWYLRVVLPAAGGIAAGLFLVLARRYRDSAVPDYMEAIAAGSGAVSVPQTLLRSASSLCTIASGGSIGREGSMVQLAAMGASLIGRAARFDPERLRLLVACGAAAGITSAYNAPIAAAFFVGEIVLGPLLMESLAPMMIASVVANITMRRLPGYHPTYEMPAFPDIANLEVPLFAALGILAGLAAPQFLRLLGFARRRFARSALPLPLRLGVAGLGVGVISVWVPQVWGNGYSVVNSLLHEPWVWSAVLAILVFKVLATLLTAGSGAVGGIFTPTLFVGAALGYLFGLAGHALWPGLVTAAPAYAIVGMGAFLAAATGAPLMAILMIFEMTLSYQAMLPLMLACVLAWFVARGVGGPSMYEITVRRQREEQERLRLRGTQMRELVKPAETVLPLDAPLARLSATFRAHPVKYVYIVDADGRYQGVVALRDLAAALEDDQARDKLAADLLRRDALPLVTPEMTLADAFEQFLAHHGERLPVVQSLADPLLLGVVYKTALLDAYARLGRD